MSEDGVVASVLEIVEVAEAARLLAREAPSGSERVPPFSAQELAYARSKSDPERRLAARLAAKRAAARALGGEVEPEDVEVRRGRYGPPALHLSPRAVLQLRTRGASRALVSLTHERLHAAARVLLLREAE
jgi:holo-[acyl-carrier protein] synthase